MNIGRIGIWDIGVRGLPAAAAHDTAAELEDLGYHTIWVPNAFGGDLFGDVRNLLDGSSRISVATGIASVWNYDAPTVAIEYGRLTEAHDGRFVLGLGVSHGPMVDAAQPGRYRAPLAKMTGFLDGLQAASPPPAKDDMVLSALGPKMLALAAERTAGAFPYLVPVEHTRRAREILGKGPVLVTEQAAILEREPHRAREIAGEHIAFYMGLPNYTNNLRTLGFDDDDFAAGGSQRLMDALVAWGDVDAIAQRVRDHFDAGADHVCIQVLTGEQALPASQWKELAPALIG